ncbi:T-complex protein 1 subunit gamma-like isoform X1 [Hibiscus syriacus]|uniref:T-complex protein 1 subunit gamma-like isoform X1 n=1 Tax=Hibiscus syriacus TaxID=106335 RepID=UPI0019218B25|nr:T-complex protein 1 subunit gamma-like isoform X1 [Hibiscus syriacus]
MIFHHASLFDLLLACECLPHPHPTKKKNCLIFFQSYLFCWSWRSMIEFSHTQDEEIGDGTTSVIVLAYNKALEDAIAVLDKIAMTIDVKHRSMVLGLVKSCIGTKFTSQFGDLIAVSVLFNQNLFLCELLL